MSCHLWQSWRLTTIGLTVDVVSRSPVPRHGLLGDRIAGPAALEVVEDFELEFGHDVVWLSLNAIPDDRVSLIEYSIFFYREGLQILCFSDNRRHESWVTSH